MAHQFQCRHCRQRLSVRVERIGREITCPRCKKPTRVPETPMKAQARDDASERSTDATLPADAATAASSRGGPVVQGTTSAGRSGGQPQTASATESASGGTPAQGKTRAADITFVDDRARPTAKNPEDGDGDASGSAPVTVTDSDGLPEHGLENKGLEPDRLEGHETTDDAGPEDEVQQALAALATLSERRESPAPREPDLPVDPTCVAVPRRVVYLQGALLGICAILFFIFGLIVGSGSSRPQVSSGEPQPCVVSGTVVYAQGGRSIPDEGSVILVIPQDYRPDEKSPIEGLRVDDPPPEPSHPGRQNLRDWGGAYARVNAQGRFRLRVPDKGRYFLLCVSSNRARTGDDTFDRRDLAELGRYFLSANQLLADQTYDWRVVNVQQDRQIDITF